MSEHEATEQGIPIFLAECRRRGVLRLVLRHATVSGALGELAEYVLDETPDLAAQIYSRAARDAEGLGGSQRYVIFAYTTQTEGARHVTRAIFRARGLPTGEDGDEHLEESEPATSTGLLAMLMRHADAATRAILQSQVATNNMNVSTIRELRERIGDLEARELQVWKAHQDLIDRSHERSMEKAREDRKGNREDRFFAKFEGEIWPAIKSRLMGIKALPLNGGNSTGGNGGGGAAPVTIEDRLAEFVHSLNREQAMTIFGVLSEAQVAHLSSLIEDVGKMQAAKADAAGRAAATNGNTNGAGTEATPP